MIDPTSPYSFSALPSALKRLIILTAMVAILSALTQSIFEIFGLFPGPQNYLSLSWWGLSHFYLWQPITFLFIQDAAGAGVTFFFLLKLFVLMYLVWVIGGILYQLIGKGPFLRLYLLGGMGAGLATLPFMWLTGSYEMIAGAAPAVLILVTVWTMAMPETEVYLFFILPLKVKWLVLYLFGAIALVTLSELDFVSFVLYLSAILIGFVYAVGVHRWHSPYPHTRKLEQWLIRVCDAVEEMVPSRFRSGHQNKIVDIDSGEPLKDDDAFVDAMLEKIARHGEESLSWSEQRRLKQISEKKMGKS